MYNHRGQPTGTNHTPQPLNRPNKEWQPTNYGAMNTPATRKQAEADEYRRLEKSRADLKAKQDAEWEAEQKNKKK